MFVDLCLCKHDGCDGKFLFYAPAFNNLKGKEVIVETKNGLAKAIVEDSLTIDTENEGYRYILNLAGATKPLRKVVSVIRYSEFDYDEETEVAVNGIDNGNE